MKKWGKLLPSVSLVLFFTTLVLVVLTSHALAKYNDVYDRGVESARPALFEFVVIDNNNPSIFVDFGMDAETAPIYGTRKLIRNYDFSVRTAQSEVTSLFTIEIFFPQKLYYKIIQADKTVPGVWVSWNMYVVEDYGLSTESVEEITNLGEMTESDGAGTWKYGEIVPQNCNPYGKVDRTYFRIEFEIFNVEDTSNIKDAFIYISNLNLSVNAVQVD